MQINEQTFKFYAIKSYDNPYCFNDAEFNDDLKKISTIMRSISWSNGGNDINIKLLVNNVISFYNVFEHYSASLLMNFKMNDDHKPKMNSILYFLSLPLLGNCEYDILFHRKITNEYRNI